VIPKLKDGLNGLRSARADQKWLLGHLMYTAQVNPPSLCYTHLFNPIKPY
ncbi:hypothetical protein B484DRAFT_457843, partial [Ochromonadaceae sp. CCMP2298]